MGIDMMWKPIIYTKGNKKVDLYVKYKFKISISTVIKYMHVDNW